MSGADTRNPGDWEQRESIRFQARLLEAAGQAIVATDVRGVIVYWNRAAERLYGWSSEEVVGRTADVLVSGELRERCVEIMAGLGRDDSWSGEFPVTHRNGESLSVLVSDTPVYGVEGEVIGMVGVSTDITGRRQMEEALHESREFLSSVLENAPTPIYIVSEEDRIRLVNRAYENLFGVHREEIIGSLIEEVFPPDMARQLGEIIHRILETGIPEIVEMPAEATDGHHDLQIATFPLRDPDGRVEAVGGIAVDVTGRRRAEWNRQESEKRPANQAFHDSLTGFVSRALFVDRLGHALARIGRRDTDVAVLFAGLEDFETIADGLGRDAGDRLLVSIAERLKACLRSEDTTARFGDDEFVILLEDIESPTDAARVAERVVRELRKPLSLEEQEVIVPVSVGISLSGFEAVAPAEMIHKAQTAMYRVRTRGDSGGYALCESGVHRRVLKRLEREGELRRAIEQEQFRLHYQPMVDLRSGRITGVETLARWEHPERGFIGPKEFIPIAEETGLIVPLGRWVLEEACRQARLWQSEFAGDEPLKMSVNFSLRQFRHPGLVEEVAETMRRTELEPASLSLEITESVAMRETEQTVSILRRLKALGLRLAIDDFGTGHTSLSYLIRQFRMDVLKIDRSFTRKLPEDPEYRAIVSAFIGLAKSLNLEVVAEGIETTKQYDLLRSMGCDTGQGFLFSRPLSSEAMSELLSEDPRW